MKNLVSKVSEEPKAICYTFCRMCSRPLGYSFGWKTLLNKRVPSFLSDLTWITQNCIKMSNSNIFTAKRNSPSVEFGAFRHSLLVSFDSMGVLFFFFLFPLTTKMEMIVSDNPPYATHGVDKD